MVNFTRDVSPLIMVRKLQGGLINLLMELGLLAPQLICDNHNQPREMRLKERGRLFENGSFEGALHRAFTVPPTPPSSLQTNATAYKSTAVPMKSSLELNFSVNTALSEHD